MCGVFGVFSLDGRPLPAFDARAALNAIRHRGPDDEGSWFGRNVMLGARRLSIIDPEGGHQPMSCEDGTVHLAMNGEIFSYELLLDELHRAGHRFHSRCDTEVALHLFEDAMRGPGDITAGIERALERIDGQYAIAAHDEKSARLVLVRDRTGICPLFYTVRDSLFIFASEMKAMFASGLVEPEIDVRGLDAVTAFGCIPPPRTLFRDIKLLPAGHFLVAESAPDERSGRLSESSRSTGGAYSIRRYWDIPYPPAGDYESRPKSAWASDLRSALEAAVHCRLRSDVPVGLYLSGGIDSATVGALISDNERVGDRVSDRVFSIGFPERGFDESHRTERIASNLGLHAQYLRYTQEDLARDFPRLLYHSEAPLISTESVPLFALSRLASQHVKVILTGEGSDEALGGYAYFYPDAIESRLGNGVPGSLMRSMMRPVVSAFLGETNPVFPSDDERAWGESVFGFYPAGAIMMFYMRMVRSMTYAESSLDRLTPGSDAELVDLPAKNIREWDRLNRSLYVSSRTFLQSHLLAAHGDRALMAHSVEGRYPFLDRRVQELLARVPPELKIRLSLYPAGEKYLLRRAMRSDLPREVLARRKKPFLAPFGTPFVGAGAPEYAKELLSDRAIAETGHFDPEKVSEIRGRLAAAADSGRAASLGPRREALLETIDGMALAFVLSVQVLEHIVRTTGYRSLPADL